jgi:hypothetical protein
VFAAAVEFWLEWMETLAPELPASARVFDWAARALLAQREAMIEQTILRGRLPARERSNGDHAAGEVSVAAFAESIGPRLRALAPAARDSEPFRAALAAWLSPRGTASGISDACAPH